MTPPQPGLVTYAEAAALVGVAPSTVRRWRSEGKLAPYLPDSRPLLFHTDDVYAAERACRHAWLLKFPERKFEEAS